MKVSQPRRLPYYLGARRQKLFLLSVFVLFFAAILLGNDSREPTFPPFPALLARFSDAWFVRGSVAEDPFCSSGI